MDGFPIIANWIIRNVWPMSAFWRLQVAIDSASRIHRRETDDIKAILEHQRLANFIWIRDYKENEPLRMPDPPPTIKLPELEERVRALEGQRGTSLGTPDKPIEISSLSDLQELKDALFGQSTVSHPDHKADEDRKNREAREQLEKTVTKGPVEGNAERAVCLDCDGDIGSKRLTT